MPSTGIVTMPPSITWEMVDEILVVQFRGVFDASSFERCLRPLKTHIRQPGMRWRVLNDQREADMAAGLPVFQVLIDYVRGNKPYIERSVALGIKTAARRFLYNRTVALTGQVNMRAFNDYDAAMAWLRA